jgi:5,10-methenyltetrahydromethanopterin hydrogenase
MTDLPHDYLPEVTQIFINLGAAEGQAQVMAAQLLKRAAQIAEERGISKVEATETLLKQVIEARQGV